MNTRLRWAYERRAKHADEWGVHDTAVISSTVMPSSRVLVGPHAVIGGEGFGYERDERGVPLHIPHTGRVVIGSGVEIGANTCIDRGTVGDTVIGDEVKLDNLVHVAHNVTIGDATMVAAGAVLCGSVSIGKRAWIGAGAVVLQHLTIGDDAVIGAGAVVTHDVPTGQVWAGNPARRLKAVT